ncbi:hypothetical protein D3C72_1373500 [compost metagenome]
MADESAGGLQARLAALGLSDAVQLRLPYACGGQGLLLMDFDLVTGADCARLEAELLDWLAFIRAASPWPGLWDERLEILRRKAALRAPLETALAAPPPTQEEVRALLEQLRAERLVRLETCESDAAPTLHSSGFPLCLEQLEVPPAARAAGDWRLPPANPYLHWIRLCHCCLAWPARPSKGPCSCAGYRDGAACPAVSPMGCSGHCARYWGPPHWPGWRGAFRPSRVAWR